MTVGAGVTAVIGGSVGDGSTGTLCPAGLQPTDKNTRSVEMGRIICMGEGCRGFIRGLTWSSMDEKSGAVGAGERSERAPNVRRFSVHCSDVLGAPIYLFTVVYGPI